MLANVLFVLGGIVGFTALLDLFLSDAQKSSLSAAVLAVWNWLDNVKQFSFVALLKSDGGVSFLSTVSAALSLSYVGYATRKTFNLLWSSLILATIMSVIVCVTAQIIIPALLSGTKRAIIVRSTGLFIVAVIGQIAALIFSTKFLSVSIYNTEPETIIALGVAIALAGGSSILLIVWIVTIVPVLITYPMSALLFVSEFGIRRIAEYPKGPILAISALCGGAAGLLKLFG